LQQKAAAEILDLRGTFHDRTLIFQSGFCPNHAVFCRPTTANPLISSSHTRDPSIAQNNIPENWFYIETSRDTPFTHRSTRRFMPPRVLFPEASSRQRCCNPNDSEKITASKKK
jgi:hypothetical protein